MRKTIAIIGEGITEKFYVESLKGLSQFTIIPQELGKKASSLKILKSEIDKAVNNGFDEVYCLIDMDGKKDGRAKQQYAALKNKYHNNIFGNKRKGIQCKVIFIENERCIELWFLYHFTETTVTREFQTYKELERELKKYRPNYEKSDKYFRNTGGIHQDLTEKNYPKGSLEQAIINAENSLISKRIDGRNYSYSEMHLLIRELKIIQ